MGKRSKRAASGGDVDYGGVVCTNPECAWTGDDPDLQCCPDCGAWTKWWITNDQSLIPPGARWRVLPPPQEH